MIIVLPALVFEYGWSSHYSVVAFLCLVAGAKPVTVNDQPKFSEPAPKDKQAEPPRAKFFMEDDADSVPAAESVSLSSNVARMTFSTGSQMPSGFTPEKESENPSASEPEKTRVDVVKKDLSDALSPLDKKRSGSSAKLDSMNGPETSSGSTTSTPKRVGSGFGLQAPTLHKSASKWVTYLMPYQIAFFLSLDMLILHLNISDPD